MSQKLTILFDLDGTLVNTAPDLMNAHNYVMRKYGYDEKELSAIKKLAGRGSKVMLTKSMHEMAELSGKIKKTDDVVEEMTKEFIDYYSKNINNESTLKNGLLNFLSWCKKNSISMAVCTNKQEHLSIDLLKKIKIYHFFDYVAGGNTFNHNKPDPKHLTDTIEIIGTKGNIKYDRISGNFSSTRPRFRSQARLHRRCHPPDGRYRWGRYRTPTARRFPTWLRRPFVRRRTRRPSRALDRSRLPHETVVLCRDCTCR